MKGFQLANEERIVISEEVVNRLMSNIQGFSEGEKGGFLLGRSTLTRKTTILDMTTPYPKDIRSFIGFVRRDRKHLEYLKNAAEKLIYFKGNWHTHPQDYPSPSCKDLLSWKRALLTAKVTRTAYIFFVIVGRKEIGIWAGSTKDKKIYKVGKF